MLSIEERLLRAEAAAATNGNAAGGIVYSEAAMKAYQLDMLSRLKEIRAAIVKDGESGMGAVGLREERDAALAEVQKLKKENDRLNYRVAHLIKALNAEEAKNASSTK